MDPKKLKIRGLSKRFGTQVVLDAIDLDIPLGSHSTVIGKSGMGKSVLLKCIAGLLESDAGEITLGENGQAIPQCSYMFQQNALFDSLTVFDNVSLPLRETESLSKSEISEKVSDLLGKLELENSIDKYPAEISGGMKKRVALARALITSPEIILFDEPTTGLDPQRKFDVFDMIRTYRQTFGFTVIMVSHDVPEVFEISDQIAWLDQGKIAYWGESEPLLQSPPEELKPFISPTLQSSPAN